MRTFKNVTITEDRKVLLRCIRGTSKSYSQDGDR